MTAAGETENLRKRLSAWPTWWNCQIETLVAVGEAVDGALPQEEEQLVVTAAGAACKTERRVSLAGKRESSSRGKGRHLRLSQAFEMILPKTPRPLVLGSILSQ